MNQFHLICINNKKEQVETNVCLKMLKTNKTLQLALQTGKTYVNNTVTCFLVGQKSIKRAKVDKSKKIYSFQYNFQCFIPAREDNSY